MPEQELLVRIVGDDRSLQQAFTRSSRGAQQFERQAETTGQSLKRGFAAAGLTLGVTSTLAFSKRLADSASDLNEEISKSQKVFGDSADEIDAWSKTTADAFGVSRTAALAATGVFGNLFRVVDIGPEAAAGMSRALVELASDLASFNNANIDDVILALRSGLIGEAEPLRRFGVLLSETRVQTEALAETGKTSAASLTNQEKALARYKIILQDTIPAQGDFADTADEAANAQRRAAAQAADLSANVGQILVPALTGGSLAFAAFAKAANDAIGAIGDFRAALRDTKAFDGFNQGVEDAQGGLSNFFTDLRDGIPLIGDFKAAIDDAFGGADTSFDEAGTRFGEPGERGGLRGVGRVEAERPGVEARQADAAAKRAKAELLASRKRFAEFLKGLDLKLKNAGLTDDLGDDLAVLQEIERNIQRRIRLEGRTFALANSLADVQTQIARKREEIARQTEDAEKKADDAEDAARDRRKARADRRRAERQGDLFEALGLTATGEQRTPGIQALRRRGRSLLSQISGTDLDTTRNRERIGAVLTKQFKDAGREVRQAILDMFNEISSALDDGQKKTGNRTKFRVANTSSILAGLGLSEDETKALRQRLSRIGAGGTTPTAGGAGGAFGFAPGGGNTIVTGPVTVVSNDPDDMGRKLERKQRNTALTRTGNQAGRHK